MKFSIEFNSETKLAKFYIDGEEVQVEECSIASYKMPDKSTKDNCVCITYHQKTNDNEAWHEIALDPETGNIMHEQKYSSSLLMNIKDVIEKQKTAEKVARVFQPKMIKQSPINNLAPTPTDLMKQYDISKDNTKYLPNFKR